MPHLLPTLLPRPLEGHKGTFGHALLIAGQWGMAGASILSAEACLRSGVGKLTVHIPRQNNDILQIAVPEACIHHDENDRHFSSTVNLSNFQALAIGPGIGTHSDTAAALHGQLAILKDASADIPLVLDADALNILALHPEWMQLLPEETIITPHPGEFSRLESSLHLTPSAMAQTFGIIVILKGHPSRIFFPNGTESSCPFGNDGMATAGSGDVLTGLILGLLAQHYSSHHAATLGVHLHAISGDLAAAALGHHSAIARDLIRYLPAAFVKIAQENTQN